MVTEGDEVVGLDRRAVAAQFAVGVETNGRLFISIVLRFDFKATMRHISYRHVFSIISSRFGS